jgi:hypothetical protein
MSDVNRESENSVGDESNESGENAPPVDKEAEEKENIKKTVELMDDIYKIVKDERFNKEFGPEERHKILLEKYKDIANMYPVVLRIMARDLRYNRVAMRRMLEKLLKDQKANAEANSRQKPEDKKKQDPLAAMKSFIIHQSDYAKLLYIEETRRAGRHLNMKTANAIWRTEYDNMNKALKKIKEDEDKARNEFKEETDKHLDERRKELLQFVLEEAPDNAENAENAESDDESEEVDERTEEEMELDELTELDNYIKDLQEAYKSFSTDHTENVKTGEKENIIHGISNEDMEEYSQHLLYCRRLFDLAVKHGKMLEEDRDAHDEDVQFCLNCLEGEVRRRNRIATEERKNQANEWIEDIIPKLKKGSKKGSGKARAKGKGRSRRKR